MKCEICGYDQDEIRNRGLVDGYNRGFRDGYREGLKDFDLKHAALVAQLEAMTKALAEMDILRPIHIYLPPPADSTPTDPAVIAAATSKS